MENYKFKKRDFSEIDARVESFNKDRIEKPFISDAFNRRIDLDYVNESDKIEGEEGENDVPKEVLLNIIKNDNLKVLKSYPRMIINQKKPLKSNSKKIVNINGLEDEQQEEVYDDLLKETELIIFDTKTNEEYRIKTTGHLRAVKEMIKNARLARTTKNQTGKSTELTAEFIADNINCHILGERFGRYRSAWYHPVAWLSNGSLCFPGGAHVDDEMEKMLNWYNNESQDLHPIERAAILHTEFVRIHPFADGNGRTARLLLNYELVKNGYPTITIKASQRGEYVEAINEAVTTGDITKMVDLVHNRLNSRLNLYESLTHSNQEEAE